MAKFGKTHADINEYNIRLEYFKTLDALIMQENVKGHNYTLGHNRFSDWSKDEYATLTGPKHVQAVSSAADSESDFDSDSGDDE